MRADEFVGMGTSHWLDPHWVYRYYDADGTLLYVGMTCRPRTREAAHRRASPWFDSAARKESDFYLGWDEAARAERHLIETLRPLHNKIRTDGLFTRKQPTA